MLAAQGYSLLSARADSQDIMHAATHLHAVLAAYYNLLPPQLPCRFRSPVVPGYTFYQLQGIVGYQLSTSSLNLVGYHDAPQLPQASLAAALADACSKFSLKANALSCNAFTTMGDLYIVPSKPRFTVLDMTSAADTFACDGVYVADAKNPFGFNGYDDDDTLPAKVEAMGVQAAAGAQALSEAASKVGTLFLGAGGL